MSTITLTGNTLCASLGIGSFTSVGNALSKAKQTTSDLANELNSLKTKIDFACTATNLDTSKQLVSNAKNREQTKKTSLSLVYDKLNNLISNVGVVDNKVSTKVEQLKNDFYSKYSYLKPECEKGALEKLKDGVKDLWDSLGGLRSAINDFLADPSGWCKQKWSELLNFVGKLINSEVFGNLVKLVVGVFDKLGGFHIIKFLAKTGTLLALFTEKHPWVAKYFPAIAILGNLTKLFFSLTLNADMDDNGVYHIRSDCWQQYVHYTTGYDSVFKSAINGATNGRLSVDARQSNIFWADLDKDGIQDKGEEFILWSWKGDYTNLGAGAETGIYQVVEVKKDKYGAYERNGDEYSYVYAEVNREYSVNMTLALYYDSNKDGDFSSNEMLYQTPEGEKHWWVTGFDPKTQNVKSEDLRAVTTVDFSSYGEEQGKIMYDAFKKANISEELWVRYDDETLTVILDWKD